MRLLLACLAGLLTVSTASAAPMFAGLGSCSRSSANAISADGSTAVGQCDGEAFRWTSSGGMGLGRLVPDSLGNAYAVSADGSTIVGGTGYWPSAYTPLDVAVRWTSSGGMMSLDLGGNYVSDAYGVSADGSTIVGDSTAGPFLWTSAGARLDLGLVEVRGVSADGATVVGRSLDGASRWTSAGGIELLDETGYFTFSTAFAISADGSTIVGATRFPNYQAFRWTSGDGLVQLGGGFIEAFAVSADGSTIVGGGSTGALVWDAINGIRPLDQVLTDLGVDHAGWILDSARGISADGLTIVGDGHDPSGAWSAWIAVIPEPSTALLLASGLATLALRRHRRAA